MNEPPVITSTETTIYTRKYTLWLETCVIIFKALAYMIVGVFTPWSASLAQWVNSGEWPSKIVWVGVILPASAISGASALLAFLSGSFRSYQDQRKQTQNGDTV